MSSKKKENSSHHFFCADIIQDFIFLNFPFFFLFSVGDLLCEETGILSAVIQFQAHLIVLNVNVPLTIGFPVSFVTVELLYLVSYIVIKYDVFFLTIVETPPPFVFFQ